MLFTKFPNSLPASTLIAMMVATTGAAFAQGNDMDAAFATPPPVTKTTTTGTKQLSGSVQRNAGLRIERNSTTPKPPEQQPYQPLDGEAFAQPPVTPAAPLAGAAQQLNAEASKTKKGNHIWHQSRQGGYYDATGQISVLVPGDELYKYGGVFEDGLAVPTMPVAMNFAKHCYRFPFIPKRPQPQQR